MKRKNHYLTLPNPDLLLCYIVPTLWRCAHAPEDRTPSLIRKLWSTGILFTNIVKPSATVKGSNMAAEIVNTSSTRPELPQILPRSNSELQGVLPSFLSSWSAWQYIVAFLLGVVVYDQGNQECRARGILHPANAVSSHVYQAKGSDRWTYIQDSAHGTIYPGTPSKVRGISCAVGEWTSQLRIRLP